MPLSKIFGGSFAVTEKALDLRATRQGFIQSNIANISTPGYSVQDFDFKKVMERTLAAQPALSATQPGHLQPEPVALSESQSFSGEKRPVDLDEEMLKLSENQLMYQISARLMAKELEDIRYAIDEGGK